MPLPPPLLPRVLTTRKRFVSGHSRLPKDIAIAPW
jgi:hypothetical protein